MSEKKIIKKLKKKFKLSIYNEATLEEQFSMRVSKMNIAGVLTGLILVSGLIIFLLIFFTDLKQVIPGFDRNLRKKIIENAITVDSLKTELDKRDRFFSSIQSILNGTDNASLPKNEKQQDTVDSKQYNIEFKRSQKEENFRKEIEDKERFNLLISAPNKNKYQNIKLFPPVQGLISQAFDATHQHYGIDIVAKPNSKISAVLDGTVIFTGWTVKTGHVIHIQHENNLVSIYKHNVELLKKTGQHVKAGEAIAIIGNTGEVTTSAHLHFEIWKNGKALNPELYIKFK